jgi:catechol 2,3-dioxygenase-like lactoylglutathione lyase family enzyme
MPPHLRIARPVTDLARAVAQYRDGLGMRVLGSFENHDGFDGAMLGVPGAAWHLEFTVCRHHPVTPAPTPEDLLVLYLPDEAHWRQVCDRAQAAGFAALPSFNPWWDRCGRTFADADGYRVVLQNAAWTQASGA